MPYLSTKFTEIHFSPLFLIKSGFFGLCLSFFFFGGISSINFFKIQEAQAAKNCSLTVTGNVNWSTASWTGTGCDGSGSNYPGSSSGDTATISTTTTGTLTLNVSPANSLTTLTLNRPSASQTFTLAMNANNLSMTDYVCNASAAGRNATITLTTGTLTISGSMTSGGAGCQLTANTGANTIKIGGTGSLPTGMTNTFTTGTVEFNGTGAQTANGYTFNNVRINNSAAAGTKVTAAGTFAVGGTLTVDDGQFDTAAATLTVTSTTTINSGGEIHITSATGSKAFNGNTTIANGGKMYALTAIETITFGADLSNSGTFEFDVADPLAIAGSVTNNGTWDVVTSATGAVTMSGTTKTTSGSGLITFASLAATSVTNNGTLTISGVLSGTLFTNGATGVLTLGNTPSVTTLTANASGNSVTYTGGTMKAESTGHYYDLTITTGSVTNVSSNITIDHNLVVSSGSYLVSNNVGTWTVAGSTTVNGGTLTINGTTTTKLMTGAITVSSGTLNGSSTVIQASNNITQSSTGIVSFSGTVTYTADATFTGTLGFGAITLNSGVDILLADSAAVTTSSTVDGASSCGCTWTQGANSTFNYGGTTTMFTTAGTLTATANNNTVNYNANGAQTLKAVAYYHLSLGTSSAKTMTGITTISGNFSVSGSASTTGMVVTTIGGNVSISGTALVTFGAAIALPGTLSLTSTAAPGLITGNNTFSVASTTTIGTGATFSHRSNTTLTFLGDVSLDGTLSNSAAGTGTVTVNGNITGGGTITLTGATNTFKQRVAADKNFGANGGSGTWAFSSLTFSNSNGASHTISTQSGATGAITVAATLTVGEAGDSAATVLDPGNKTWTLTANGTPISILSSPAGSICAPATCVTNTSTFNYDPTNNNVTVTLAAIGYYHLTLDNTNDSTNSGNTYTLGGSASVAGQVKLGHSGSTNADTFNISTFTLTLSSSGSTTSQPLCINNTDCANSVKGLATFSSGTIEYTGSTATEIALRDNAGTAIGYGSLSIKPAGSVTHTLGSTTGLTLSIAGNLILGNGTNSGVISAVNNPTINIGGNMTIALNTTYTKGTGTTTFNSSTVSGVTYTDSTATKQNIGKVTITKSHGTPANNKVTLASSMTVDIMTISANNTLDMASGSYTLTIANTGAVATVFDFSGSATFTAGNGTVEFTATNSGGNIEIGCGNESFYNLTLTGNETYVDPVCAQYISNTLTVNTNATFSPANTYITGDFTGAGTVSVQTGYGVDVNCNKATCLFGPTGNNDWTFEFVYINTLNAYGSTSTVRTASGGSGKIIISGGAGSRIRIGTNTQTYNVIFDNETNDRVIDINSTSTTSGDGFFIDSKGTYQASSSASFTNTSNWKNSGTFTSGTGTITFDAGGNSRLIEGTLTGSSGKFNNITFNNAAGGWTFNAAATISNDFIITTGSVTAPSGNLTIGRNFTNGGTFTHNNGTVILDTTTTSVITGSTTFYSFTAATATKIVQIDTSTTITTSAGGVLTLTGITITRETGDTGSWTINHQGTEDVSSTTISWSACDVASTEIDAFTTSSNVNGGNNGVCWRFSSGIAVSGTVYLNDESTPDTTGYTIKISINGGSAVSSTSDGSGIFTINTVTVPSAGQYLTLWLDTGGGARGTTIFKYGTSCTDHPSCSGVKLVRDQIRLENFDSGSLVNTNFSTCDADTGTGCADNDIGFTSNSSTLTVSSNWELKLAPGVTFAPGGDVSTPKLDIPVTATYSGSTETLTLSGSGTNTSCTNASASPLCTAGTFTAPATTTFTGTSSSLVAGQTYNILNLTPAATVTYTLGNGLLASGAVTIGNGSDALTVDASVGNPSITIRSNLTLASGSIFTKGSGTITFSKGSSQTFTDNTASKQDIGAVQISTNGGATTLALGSNVKMTTLTVDSSQIFSPGSNSLTLTGSSGTPFALSGTFTRGTSTIVYAPSASSTITITSSTYHNLTVNSASTTFNLTSSGITTDDGGDLTITAGTLDTVSGQNYPISVGGNFSGAGTFQPRSGTVTFTATSSKTITPNSFYNIVLNGSGGSWDFSNADVTIASDLTLTAGTLADTNSNITVNGGDVTGTAGIITLTGGTFTLSSGGSFSSNNNSWTFNNLTFTGSGNSTTAGATGTISINNILTIDSNHTLNAGGYTWNLLANSSPFVITGTFNADTSTFIYIPADTTGVTVTSATYYHITFNKASNTFSLAAGGISTSNGGNVTITAGTLDTVSGQNYPISVGGSWSNSDTFLARSGTVTFTATAVGKTISGATATNPFYNLIFNGASGGWSNSGTVQINNDVQVTNGTWSGTGSVTVLGGDVTGNGTITRTGGTFTISGASGTGFGGNAATWTFSNLTFGNGSDSAESTTIGSVGITVSGVLTIASTHTLTNNTANITLSGNGTPLVISGTANWTAGLSLTYTSGSGVTALASTSLSVANLVISGSSTFNATSDVVAHNLTITGGTLALGSSNLTVGNTSVSNSGNIKVAQSQTLSQSSSATTTILSSSSGSNCIGSSGASCVGTAGTITFGNLSIGDDTTTIATAIGGTAPTITIGGSLTINNNATFNGSTGTIAINGNGASVFVKDAAGTFTPSSSTVTFSSTNTTGTTIPTLTYYNLIVNRSSNAFTVASGTLTVNNNLTISAGTLALDTNNPTVAVLGNLTITSTLTASQSSILYIRGNFTNNGTFTHNNGTVNVATIAGATTTIAGANSTTFYNLEGTTPNTTLQFKNSATTTFAGAFTVLGSAGNPITVRSDSTNVQWDMYITGAGSTMNYVYIFDTGCHAGTNVPTLGDTVINAGNNGQCWAFILRSGGGASGGESVSGGGDPLSGGGQGGGGGSEGEGGGGDGQGGGGQGGGGGGSP